MDDEIRPLPWKKTLQSINANAAGSSNMIMKKRRMWPYTVGTNVHVLCTTSAGNDTGNETPLPSYNRKKKIKGRPPLLRK